MLVIGKSRAYDGSLLNISVCYVGTSLSILPSPSALAGLPAITTLTTMPPSLVVGPSGGAPATVPAGTAHSGSGALTWLSSSAGVSSGSAGLLNILPLSLARVLPPTGGVYVGEGLPPIPPKLAAKILKWEIVEMAEMLPEYWPGAKSDEDDSKRAPTRHTCQVNEIFTWIQCCASYVSVLAGRFTESVLELMAYLVTITQVSQDFTGLAWVRYDASFRRQAAITSNRKWSQINPSLYSICFTGCALAVKRCELCLSAAHTTKQCALLSDPDSELPDRLKAVESVMVSLASRLPTAHMDKGKRPMTAEICRLYNENCCRFPKCRYRHLCAKCGNGHPACSCPQALGPIPTPSAMGARRGSQAMLNSKGEQIMQGL